MYLKRILAYNGSPAATTPAGLLGPVATRAHAGQLNALCTLNLRPAARERWGFDARKRRSFTDSGPPAQARHWVCRPHCKYVCRAWACGPLREVCRWSVSFWRDRSRSFH
jgi:hypothetical protein